MINQNTKTKSVVQAQSNLKPLLDQNKMPLFESLVHYAKKDVTPFDVPGHKMGVMMNPLKMVLGEMAMRMDVNSMKELDLLSHPQSVIKEAQELAADAFGADYAYFLVNGTTVGIIAMILAVVKPGDSLLVPRNCHKSVMNGIILSGAKPIFIQPEIDLHFGISHGVSLENVQKALTTNPDIKAILITYPTYFGAMDELEDICKLAHNYDVTVIVDSAHGAHLPFLPGGIVDPLRAGADAVTISMHKTGGSLTQSSLLLLQGNRIPHEKMQKVVNMLQSTSANYLLISSLDVARRELALFARERFIALKPIVNQAIYEIEKESRLEVLKSNYVISHFHQTYDWTKLVIRVNGIGLTGFEVYTLLKEKYNIQMELAEGYVVMAVISSSDSQETIGRLVFALKDIEKKYGKQSSIISTNVIAHQINELLMIPRDAFYAEQESLPINEALGRISADTLMIYPPGIPLVIPGELISNDVINQYYYYLDTVGHVLTEGKKANYIKVVKEDGGKK